MLPTPAPNRHGREVPPRALFISLLALMVPLTATLVLPSWFDGEGLLLAYLPVLLPAFLLSYHKGWKGASLALAGGMATLALSQVEIMALDLAAPRWDRVFWMVTILVIVSLGSGWLAELLLAEREKAESAALTDPLTGLPNRRHLAVFLEWAWAAAVRGRVLSVVLFDLDDFKRVNDLHGHASGDDVLRVFGKILEERGRKMDIAARFGGEEFISILIDCNLEQAVAYAESIRKRMAEQSFRWGSVTVSAGAALMEKEMSSPDVLIAAADRALYDAKERGRNQVCTPKSGTRVGQPMTIEGTDLPWRRGIRALLVDDDAWTLEATTRLLEKLGCVVQAAQSGPEALRLLELSPDIEILITDIVMPDMSGFTLVDLASKAHPDLPVLYLSGYERRVTEWPGVPGLRSAFLKKPVDVGSFQAAITELTSGAPMKAHDY